MTEIFSNYFDEYKAECLLDDEDDEDEDYNTDINNNEINNDDFTKPLTNNSKLIQLMNKYHISISGLENILKIEKLNQINEKRKKKFTLKIKKEISNFLVTKE